MERRIVPRTGNNRHPGFQCFDGDARLLQSLNGSTTVPILVQIIDDGSDQPVRLGLEEYARDRPGSKCIVSRRTKAIHTRPITEFEERAPNGWCC